MRSRSRWRTSLWITILLVLITCHCRSHFVAEGPLGFKVFLCLPWMRLEMATLDLVFKEHSLNSSSTLVDTHLLFYLGVHFLKGYILRLDCCWTVLYLEVHFKFYPCQWKVVIFPVHFVVEQSLFLQTLTFQLKQLPRRYETSFTPLLESLVISFDNYLSRDLTFV